MEISAESKFEIGQTIHFMNKNKPDTTEIKYINVCVTEKEIEIKYYTSSYKTLKENECFATKAELKHNLFNE